MFAKLGLALLLACAAQLSQASRLFELETEIPELRVNFDPAWLSRLYHRANEASKLPPDSLISEHFFKNADVKQLIESVSGLVEQRLAELRKDQDWMRQVNELTRQANETLSNETSEICMEKVKFFFDAIPKLPQNGWVLAVLDTLGKPPSGIFQQILPGSPLRWTGEYRQCEALNGTDINGTIVWKGQYCSLTIQPVRIGICVPKECNSRELVIIINQGIELVLEGFGGVIDNISAQLNQFLEAAGKFPLSGIINLNPMLKQIVQFLKTTVVPILGTAQSLNISNVDFRIGDKSIDCINETEPLDAGAITAIVVISILAFLVLVSSLIDIFISFLPDSDYTAFQNEQLKINSDEETKNGHIQSMEVDEAESKRIGLKKAIQNNLIVQILLSFSIVTNTRKIFKITKTKDQLDCLNGIRFLSIAWVVLGHTHLVAMSWVTNPVRTIRIFQSPLFQIVTSGVLSVDSFFLLSGLLNAYIFLKETQKQKISPKLVGMYYFHRIWRLTPPLALVIMTSATLTPYLGNGPNYPKNGFQPNKCADNWWTNLIYLNNFIMTDQTQQCLGVTWYLANDFQFYVFALGILIMFYYGKKNWAMKMGAYGICLFLACSQVLITGLIMNYETDVDPLAPESNWFEKVYVKPYHRWSPYVVGLALGNVILEHREKIKIPRLVNFILHLVSFTLMGLVVFGQYKNFNPVAGALSHEANVLYNATFRLAWALALGYIIYACVINRTRFINSFLSHEFWVPLSRLNYMVYLIHMDVIVFFFASSEKPPYFENNTLAIYFCGILMICVPIAYIFCMLFEAPMVGLERVIFKKKK